MVSLHVNFGGIELRNPVIVASSPATESVKNIVKCWESGAGGVVTKSIASYDKTTHMKGARRVYVNDRGMWVMSTFERETLPLDVGIRLIADSVSMVDVPIIASVTALDSTIESWYPPCYALQQAGASMIQLDLFYFPQPICVARNIAALTNLLKYLCANLSIPVMIKLNIEMPARLMAEVLGNLDIAGVSYLDSVLVPPPIIIEKRGMPAHMFVDKPRICSLFGSWQKPLTLQYTYLLSSLTRIPLCAGGGLMNGKDAIEIIMMGATLVQFATAVLLHGYGRITEIVTQIEGFLGQSGYEDINMIRGISHQYAGLENETGFINAKAQIDPVLCTNCGECLNLVFCDAIVIEGGKVKIIDNLCEGCGLCKFVCNTGALQIIEFK